jgi:hypothetical protein
VRSILKESEFVAISADQVYFARNDLGSRSARHPDGSDDKTKSDKYQTGNRYENDSGQAYGFHGHPFKAEVLNRLSHTSSALGISDVHWSTTAQPTEIPTARDRRMTIARRERQNHAWQRRRECGPSWRAVVNPYADLARKSLTSTHRQPSKFFSANVHS